MLTRTFLEARQESAQGECIKLFFRNKLSSSARGRSSKGLQDTSKSRDMREEKHLTSRTFELIPNQLGYLESRIAARRDL
jgi:hypothetical protein